MLSSVYKGVPSALELTNGRARAYYAGGRTEELVPAHPAVSLRVQQVLGHRSLRTTELYMHVTQPGTELVQGTPALASPHSDGNRIASA